MVVSSNVRYLATRWARRLACYFIGVTSATGMFVMLMGGFLIASGVLEW